MMRLHTRAYTFVQVFIALTDEKHAWYTGEQVKHPPTPVDKMWWWGNGPARKDFAEMCMNRFMYEESDEARMRRLKRIADRILLRIGHLGQVA